VERHRNRRGVVPLDRVPPREARPPSDARSQARSWDYRNGRHVPARAADSIRPPDASIASSVNDTLIALVEDEYAGGAMARSADGPRFRIAVSAESFCNF
jgi:hypothetical protein